MITAMDARSEAHTRQSLSTIGRRLFPAAFHWDQFVGPFDTAMLGGATTPAVVLIEAIDLSTSLRRHRDVFPVAYSQHLDELGTAYAGQDVLLLQIGFNNTLQVLRGPSPLSTARRFTTEEFDYEDGKPGSILLPGTRITSAIELICAPSCYLRRLGFQGLIRTGLMTDGWNCPRPSNPAWEQESAFQAWQGLEGLKLLEVPFDLFAFIDADVAPHLKQLRDKLHLADAHVHIMTTNGRDAWAAINQVMRRVTGCMSGEFRAPGSPGAKEDACG